jgi:hypothetical protein
VTTGGIKIEGLAQFRADCRRAIGAAPVELSKALRAAGEPIKAEAANLSPRISGDLASSYWISVRGVTGRIESHAPYGPGAEWGRRGKWSGFAKYGEAGDRFAGRGLETRGGEVEDLLTHGLEDVFRIYGWAT